MTCDHDGTATGVLRGARFGRLVPLIVCERCGTTIKAFASAPYALDAKQNEPEAA